MAGTPIAEVIPHDDVLLIAIGSARLDERSTEQLVEDVYSATVERPKVPIVLDMARVKFAPSVALGALVKMSNSFKLDGRRIALISVDRRVRDVINVTKLDSLLELHHNVEQVIAAGGKSK